LTGIAALSKENAAIYKGKTASQVGRLFVASPLISNSEKKMPKRLFKDEMSTFDVQALS